MGSHPNIDFDKFPKQADSFGAPGTRANICFNFDSSKTIGATVLRNDIEEPGEFLFMLDDGRVVRSVECMWQPGHDEAPHGWVCAYAEGVFWAPRRSMLHDVHAEIRPATKYEKALIIKHGRTGPGFYMAKI